MSSSPGEGLRNGDEDVATPFQTGSMRCFVLFLAGYREVTTWLSGPKALSRSDITGSGIGQGIATAGSSQRNPRARSGW